MKGTNRYPARKKPTKPNSLSPTTTVDIRGVNRYQTTPVPSGHGDATGNVHPSKVQFQQGGSSGAGAPNAYVPPIHIASGPSGIMSGGVIMGRGPNAAPNRKVLPHGGSV